MKIPYIWLGKNSEVLPSGNIDLGAIGTDKWTIRPLLGWKHDPSGVTPDSFIPALLIRKEDENPALNQLLKVIGAIEDTDITSKPAIGRDWLVFQFDKLEMQAPSVTTVNLADFPSVPEPAFIEHKDSISIALTAQGVDPLVLSTLKLNDPKVQIETPLSGGAAIFKLSFFLKELDLGKDRVFDLTGKNLEFEFDIDNGKLKINGVSLDDTVINLPVSQPILTPILLPIHIPGVEIFIRIEEIDSNLKFGFEISILNGSYTCKPLIPAISDSNVVLDWTDFRICLYDDRLGLAAPPGAPDSKLMTANFTLPLIQAKIGGDIANTLSKLMPAEVSNTTLLTPLKFKVTINRPGDPISLQPLLWTFEQNENSLLGKPYENGLQTLKAVFEEGITEVGTKLNSFFSQLKELTGVADSALSFTVGKIENLDLINLFKTLDAFNTTDYPLPLILRIEHNGSPLEFLLVLRLNLWRGRLNDNRAYFYIIGSDSGLLDLNAFAIQLPVRAFDQFKNLSPEFRLPTKEMHDGYLDFEALDLVIDVEPKTQPNRPQTTVFVPGDFTKNADQKKTEQEQKKRVQLRLEDFDPDL